MFFSLQIAEGKPSEQHENTAHPGDTTVKFVHFKVGKTLLHCTVNNAPFSTRMVPGETKKNERANIVP